MNKVSQLLECLRLYGPEKVNILGSYARGEMDDYGDSAFAVVQETRERFTERLVQVAKLIPNDLGRVDVFAYTPEKFEKVREGENPSRYPDELAPPAFPRRAYVTKDASQAVSPGERITEIVKQ